MKLYMVGRRPPPIGGVTIHTDRLISWLSREGSLQVSAVSPEILPFLKFMAACAFDRQPAVVHCQISSASGLIGVWCVSRLLGGRKKRLVYSIHSERWVSGTLHGNSIRALLSRLAIRDTALVIADNPGIERDIRPYCGRVERIVPFLPPLGELGRETLAEFLGLPAFDSPAVVFNAYKISLDAKDDIYGWRVMLDAFFRIEAPLTIVLLIPQLTDEQRAEIVRLVAGSGSPNSGRVHLIARQDLEGWKAIAKADLFVRPTLTDGDALSIREALFYGVATIASDCTKRPEGVSLFRTGDAADLKLRILEALSARANASPQGRSVAEPDPAREFVSAYLSLL